MTRIEERQHARRLQELCDRQNGQLLDTAATMEDMEDRCAEYERAARECCNLADGFMAACGAAAMAAVFLFLRGDIATGAMSLIGSLAALAASRGVREWYIFEDGQEEED